MDLSLSKYVFLLSKEHTSIYRDNDYAGLEDLLWAYYRNKEVNKS